MKGTITWLPIEDAPLYEEIFLWDAHFKCADLYPGYRNEMSKKIHREENGDRYIHFAYINQPEATDE